MKRPALHIAFWLVYLVQDALLHYTWMAPAMKGTPVSKQVLMAILTSFALLLPKLLAVYYFILSGLRNIMDETKDWTRRIVLPLLVLIVSLFLFRVIFHYLVIPRIYSLSSTAPFLDPKNTLIAVLDMGYVTGVAIAFKLLRWQAAFKDREKNLLRDKLETELKYLRNQTNPHFLFNTLNNIYGLARKKSDKTPEVVMKLSELLSFMLYESKKETIAISEEIKMLEDYISLEKIRYGDRLSITFNRQIDNGSQLIAPLLLLPLIENAFKHGASEARFDSFITITLSLHKGQLDFRVENTVENERLKAPNGNIGLTSIQRQLELMYQEHDLTVTHSGKTFIVKIAINLNSYGKL